MEAGREVAVAVEGSATYKGGAAGKYAILSTTDESASGGHFTANATLRANFDASPHYSRLAADLSEASGIGRVDSGFRGGFRYGLEIDVRGSSGGTRR